MLNLKLFFEELGHATFNREREASLQVRPARLANGRGRGVLIIHSRSHIVLPDVLALELANALADAIATKGIYDKPKERQMPTIPLTDASGAEQEPLPTTDPEDA